MPSARRSAELILVADCMSSSDLSARLTTAIARVRPSSVILRPHGAEAGAILDLAQLLQSAGIAALIEADARLARTLRADGVYLTWSQDGDAALDDARSILGCGGIVGIDAGLSRHDAMTLGQAADFIAFAIADDEEAEAMRAKRIEHVAWWAEIFEVPCIAMDVATPQEAGNLAAAGADFIAITLKPSETLAELDSWLQSFNDAVTLDPATT